MHYGQTAFSARGEITIRTADSAYQNAIGQRQVLSFEDVREVNKAYRCFRGCQRKNIECGPHGYLGQDCQCWCPTPRLPGFGLSVMPAAPATLCDLLPNGGNPNSRLSHTTRMAPTTKKSTTTPTTTTTTTTTTTAGTNRAATTTTVIERAKKLPNVVESGRIDNSLERIEEDSFALSSTRRTAHFVHPKLHSALPSHMP